MKVALLRVARAVGLFALASWLTRRRLRILAYHGIWEGQGHFGNFLFMQPHTFEARMQFLAHWGACVLPLGEALERMQEGRLPPRAVVITIDDGWQGSCRVMSDCLGRQGFPATLYVCSYYADRQKPVFDVMLAYLYHLAQTETLEISLPGAEGRKSDETRVLTREDVADLAADCAGDSERQELLRSVAVAAGLDYDELTRSRQFHLGSREELRWAAASGLDLQLHTHRHRTRYEGHSCLSRELDENRQFLARLAHGPLVHFCYPSGRYDESDWPVLEECGIASATTTEIGLASRRDHLFALPRILDGENLSLLELEAELSGFLELVRVARRGPGR